MKYNQGFSLIELIVVISVIALLAGAMIPTSVAILDIERAKATNEDIAAIDTAAQNFYMDVGNFPGSLDQLSTNPGSAGWRGPYLMPKFTSSEPTDNNVTHDRWRQQFRTRIIAGNPPQFFVWSFGPNRLDNNGQNDGSVATDDISRTIIVTTQVETKRKEQAQQELAIFNAAVANYQRYIYNPASTPNITTPPYLGNWTMTANLLRTRNLMTLNVVNDPWGSPYQFNGSIVTSTNIR